MSSDNPWKTLSSREIYSNPWFSVREDQVIRPDGKPGIYGVVSSRIATGVVALSEKNEIYLVGQFRYPMNAYSWEIIEGGTDDGETPLDCIKRELREEAGLLATEWREIPGEIHLSNCYTSERGFLFIARGLTEVPAEPDGTEVLTVKKLPFNDALAMVERGEINDGMSVIGILRAKRMLGL